MAGNTKFGLSPSGQIVYRSSGNLARSDYFTVGNTVYKPAANSQGRVKVGTLARSTVKASERRRAQIAESRRIERRRYALKKDKAFSGRSALSRLKSARQEAMRQMQHPKLIQKQLIPTQTAPNFKKSVEKMAEYIRQQDPQLYEKIRRMDADKLMQLYEENDIIFEVYFDYGDINTVTDSKGRQKGVSAGKETRTNAEFLVNAYESRFGTIA